jgi:tetratricopeptide (TPR) repeat protein
VASSSSHIGERAGGKEQAYLAGRTREIGNVEKIERLLVSGETEAAWRLIETEVSGLTESKRDRTFLVHAWFLAMHYGAEDRVLRWIEIYAERALKCARDQAAVGDFCRALLLPVLQRNGRVDESLALERVIDWRNLVDFPVLHHYRFLLLCFQGRIRGAFDVLRAIEYPQGDAYALAHRSLVLLRYFARRRRVAVCIRLAHRALLIVRDNEGLVSRLLPALVYAQLAEVFQAAGHYELAEKELEKLFALCARYEVEYWRREYADDAALVQVRLGRRRNALDILAASPLPDITTAPHVDLRALRRRINRARVYLRMGEPVLAGRLLDQCARLLRKTSSPFLEGYFHRNRGMLCALRGTRYGFRRAFSHFRHAEEIFRGLGFLGLHGLTSTLAERGELHLRRKEIPEAIECIAESLRLADDVGELHVKARCLVVKSYLLLEGAYDQSKEDLYEEVLRQLGVVHSPVLLFEILANLYMYSWDLGERVDLTAYHHNQLEKLREILDADVFRELYQKHVVLRVARRTMTTLFGVKPEDLAAL